MTAESDIAAIDDSGANTAGEVRTALTSVLARGADIHVAARIYRSSDQSLSSSVDDKIDFNAEQFDTDGDIANTASSRLDIQDTGYYLVNGFWPWTATAPNDGWRVTIYVNGSEALMARNQSSYPPIYGSGFVSGILPLSASDYVELYAFTDGQSGVSARGGASAHTRAYLELIRLA